MEVFEKGKLNSENNDDIRGWCLGNKQKESVNIERDENDCLGKWGRGEWEAKEIAMVGSDVEYYVCGVSGVHVGWPWFFPFDFYFICFLLLIACKKTVRDYEREKCVEKAWKIIVPFALDSILIQFLVFLVNPPRFSFYLHFCHSLLSLNSLWFCLLVPCKAIYFFYFFIFL